MTLCLQLVFAAINQVKGEANALRSQLVPKVSKYFASKRSGIFFFDQLRLANRNLQKILTVALSSEQNPVARYLAERHTLVHAGLVTSPKV